MCCLFVRQFINVVPLPEIFCKKSFFHRILLSNVMKNDRHKSWRIFYWQYKGESDLKQTVNPGRYMNIKLRREKKRGKPKGKCNIRSVGPSGSTTSSVVRYHWRQLKNVCWSFKKNFIGTINFERDSRDVGMKSNRSLYGAPGRSEIGEWSSNFTADRSAAGKNINHGFYSKRIDSGMC